MEGKGIGMEVEGRISVAGSWRMMVDEKERKEV